MAFAQAVVKMGRQLRIENNLKVRQPLSKLYIISPDAEEEEDLARSAGIWDLMEDELNVKEIFASLDESQFADVTVKADYKALGLKCGAKMKTVAAEIAKFSLSQINQLKYAVRLGLEPIEVEGIEVSLDDVIVQYKPKAGMVVAAEGNIIVALDTSLTPELVQEGLAREFVSRVQNLRKEADFEVTQRIAITVSGDDEVKAAVGQFADYIKAETLCEKLDFADSLTVEPCELNGHQTGIEVISC
jgi:isoleucyl-tRNA synthetase